LEEKNSILNLFPIHKIAFKVWCGKKMVRVGLSLGFIGGHIQLKSIRLGP